MGNSRPGGALRPRDGGGTATENAGAGAGTGTNASGRPMVPAARSGTNKTVTDAPRLPRRSARNAPAPSQETASTGLGNVMRPCSERQQNTSAAEEAPLGVSTAIKTVADAPRLPRRSAWNAPVPSQETASTGLGNVMRLRPERQQNTSAAEEAPLGVSTAIKATSSGSLSRDSDRSVGSRKRGDEQMSENASSSSKKRKLMNSRSYIKRFKMVRGANAAGAVVASPDRVGKENTSGGHVADSNISKLCEGSRLIGKNKRDSSDAVSKVSRSLVFGLRETSETRVNQCSAPFLEELSTSDCTNTEHIEIDNIAKPSMLLGGATSLDRGVNANYDDTLDTDGVHLESPGSSSQSLVALVGTQAVLSCISSQHGTDMSAQQNVGPSQCPPAEAEQTGLSGTQAVQVLQPEMQPSILFVDAPAGKTHPDYRSQTGCEPDRATGLLEEGAATCHHSGDVRMQVQEKFDGNVAADPVLPESPTYPADSPVTLHLSTKVESQICEPSMAAKQSTNPPAQQTSAISRNPSAEAEQSGMLGTDAAWDLQTEVQPLISMQDQPTEAERACTLGSIAAQDLHPEMQSSTLTQDVSFERTYLSRMPVIQSPDVFQCVGPSLDSHAGVEPADAETAGILGAEPDCNLQPKVQPSTSVQDERAEAEDEPEVPEVEDESEVPEVEDEPEAEDKHAEAEQARTLGGIPQVHPLPQDLQPADILITEAACGFQPSQGEVQPSTSMQDQPAEESACILGAIAAQSLQRQTQPSTAMQSASFERTYLVGMPVLQSLTLHRSVEPSLDSHARAESTHTLGALTARDLQSEVQLSASMQDRSAEAEGAVMLGSTAAQDLQPELQSLTTVQDVPRERVYSEERTQIGFQPNMVPGPEQPIQIPPVTTLVFNNPILSDDPLKNEYGRLMHSNIVLSKDHEHKKSLLLIEYNQEIEKINKNYDSLLQNEDFTYHQKERDLTDMYRKVYLSKSLAENFRGLLPPSSAGQGGSTSPVVEQPFETSSAAQTAASPVILSSAMRPPMHNSPRSYVRPSFVAQPSWSSSNALPESTLPRNPAPVQYGSYESAGAQSHAVQPQLALHGNRYRTMSHVPPPHLTHRSYGSAGTQLRASAPHLWQPRTPSPYGIHADQQQLPPANAGRPSLGQYVPVSMGSFASTIPQRGARQNSMDSSSVHQTMLPSASSSLPSRPAYSLSPGRHLESMLNSLQSSSSNPAFFAAQQSWYQNIALGSTSGPPTAAPGSQHAGAQIAGTNQSGSLSLSTLLDSYLTARLGLGSSSCPAGAEASPVVVCLSDDESS